MAGITSYGAYIPIYRLKRDEIARAWGGGARGGEKAAANWDEDSLTMGVEAAINCLNAIDRELIDGLYSASTTPPYREKQSASILAAGAGLGKELIMADFTDSIRAGASAGRYVVVVDDDINPCDIDDVMWAVCTRSEPVEMGIIKRAWSTPLDPRIRKPPDSYHNSRGIIYAVKPYEWYNEFPPTALATDELRRGVFLKWADHLDDRWKVI